jgi:serine/threonine protein kinase
MEKVVDEYLYDPAKQLASGAFGAVFRGRHVVSGRAVAIKVIRLKDVSNDIEKMLLRNEIAAVQKVSHPNVVGCEKVLQTPNHIYLVLELCEGGDMGSVVKRAPYPEQQALPLFSLICQGYQAVAQAGIVHRDIKVSNILLHEGAPKIADFGFCEMAGGERA